MSMTNPHQPDDNNAANLIRQKLNTIYKIEPDVIDEAIESTTLESGSRSKHQKYMYELSISGRPLAEIQTAWHNYYQNLSSREKHQVWQEFYAANQQQSALFKSQAAINHTLPETRQNLPVSSIPKKTAETFKSFADLKHQVVGRVRKRGKLSSKQHIQSLFFGLAMGGVVVLILLFGLFNERFIAPFITPSRNVSATPIITDPSTAQIGSEPEVIIPKINVQVPVVYDVTTIDEASLQKGLERGVVHYSTTSSPGEQGNTVIFGHSSNNILNRGKYKFAFVLLSRLEIGDTFYLQKDGIRYVYKIYDKKVVSPTEFSVLDAPTDKRAIATLITCDPPGTTISRMVVIGEQISPDPNGNVASTAIRTDQKPQILAGNPESLWHRFVGWLF